MHHILISSREKIFRSCWWFFAFHSSNHSATGHYFLKKLSIYLQSYCFFIKSIKIEINKEYRPIKILVSQIEVLKQSLVHSLWRHWNMFSKLWGLKLFKEVNQKNQFWICQNYYWDSQFHRKINWELKEFFWAWYSDAALLIFLITELDKWLSEKFST